MPNVTAMYLYGNNFTGKLILPESFYEKMGRRFGAWDNPNLCYSLNMSSTSHVPFGVEQCQDRVDHYGTAVKSSKLEGTVKEVPRLVVSGEYTRNGLSHVYLVIMLMLLLFLDFAI